MATPSELRVFSVLRQDVQAVLQRCGADTFELILVDLEGDWTMWVFPSEEAARAVAADLQVPLNEGWSDHLTRRVNARDAWNQPGGRRRAL